LDHLVFERVLDPGELVGSSVWRVNELVGYRVPLLALRPVIATAYIAI